ncbi:hypothetical protein SAMN04488074_118126 [Lentzea albidocapillata subsp. violacea]|uniref:Uncharacterized protein n=1 Tax=Lentzea albidocapillata subsp. violacea TaxID=128104 RepID=A0A1G9RJE2_9PSEU|nr:hypothetical protein [Lentzea albidocapillata]SDM23338.1 hypothetical protein SAMN04488074_118126 [Lentzea albidocapillata subsp. violacea]
MRSRVRALRYGLFTTAVVLVVCFVVALFSWLSYSDDRAVLASLTSRDTGEVVSFSDGAVEVRWPSGTARVAYENGAHVVGRQTQVAFDPADPSRAVIPGSDLFLETDRALGGVTFSVAVALLVVLAGAVRVLLAVRPARAPGTTVSVRRIRLQSGLMVRSWLEIEGPVERWLPVYYDPVLVTLPSPSDVELRGGRVAVVDGVTVYPSGRPVTKHPRGRRLDNPVRPDPDTRAPRGLTAQLRVDAVFMVPAPVVGLFWAYLDGSGFTGWITATVIAAVLGLWWAALRGSDPS